MTTGTRTIQEMTLADAMSPGEGMYLEVYALAQPLGDKIVPVLEMTRTEDFKSGEPLVLNADSARELWLFLDRAYNFSGTPDQKAGE